MRPSPEQPETLLRRRLPAPGSALRERVLKAAEAAWDQDAGPAEDIPWTGPVFRLAASLALAGLLLWGAHHFDRTWTPARQPSVPTPSRMVSDHPGLAAFSGAGQVPARRIHPNSVRSYLLLQQQLDRLLNSNG